MSLLDPDRRRRTTLILLVLTSITILSLDYQGFKPLEAVQGVVRGFVDPIASSVGSVASPFTNGWTSITEYDDVLDENERLRSELAAARSGIIKEAAAEESLRALLDEVDIDYIGGAESIVGQVIDRPGNFQNYSIEINRGASDGLRAGMPVVSNDGLVGRVTDVQQDFSEVRLLHQPDFRVGIRVVGTGAVALASGDGIGNDLIVKQGLDQESGIEEGAFVVTSGIEGSSYPPDVVIGTVSSVEVNTNLLQQTISIELLADLDDLRFVTVLLWTVDGPPTP